MCETQQIGHFFGVLGKFWITIAKFKAIIVRTNAQASKEKEKQGSEQKRIQANTLFALKECVYDTGRGVYLFGEPEKNIFF